MAKEARTWTATCEEVVGDLRRRLAELEAWKDGPVKDLSRDAVRAEMTRVGREMVELEWRWA